MHKLTQILDDLKSQNIEFKLRENKAQSVPVFQQQTAVESFSGTLTYYGKAATFNNHLDTTKIRMRVRYYIEGVADPESGEKFDVQRARKTAETGFIELKIKNPISGESSSKLTRICISLVSYRT